MPLSRPSFSGYLRHLRMGDSPAAFSPEAPATRPKLSREQLAATAGWSVGYVARLEQGRAENPSDQAVLDFSKALNISPVELQHLRDLAAAPHVHPKESATEDGAPTITPVQREAADNLAPTLSAYVDEAWNVFYCNEAYSRLFRHIDDPAVGNVLNWFFLVPESKAIMREWESEARLTVAWLRALMARRPNHPSFGRVLDELERSPDFRRMWDYHEVIMGRHKPHFLLHDLDHGRDMTLLAQVYPMPDPTQSAMMYLGIPVG